VSREGAISLSFVLDVARRPPVKVQQRTSGGCWRTLDGLADFAIVQSYSSTAAKWGIDALTPLFTDGPWLPTAIRPGPAPSGMNSYFRPAKCAATHTRGGQSPISGSTANACLCG
jgi:hypothetical protein